MTTNTTRFSDLHTIPQGARRAVITLTLGWLAGLAAVGCGGDESTAKPGNNGGSSGAGTAGAGGQGGSATTATGGGGGQGGAGGGLGGAAAGGAGGTASGGAGGMAAGGAGGMGGSGPMVCSPGRALSLSANIAVGKDVAEARAEIDFGADPELPVGNANRTIEFWAFVPADNWVGGVNTMFFYGTEQPRPACGFGLDFGSNGRTLDPFTNGGFDADNIAVGVPNDTDKWFHFAMTWDGTAVRTFVGGVEVNAKMGEMGATMLKTSGSTATNPLVIGAYPTHGYFSGAIDEFRVWNVARSAAEITATMNKPLVGNETGLTAYYKFDETSGTTIADSVAPPVKAHNGTLKAADPASVPTFIVSTAPICP